MRFHPLTVAEVRKETRDAVVVRFAEDLPFAAGQYLTFRREIGGQEVRRSYSICVAPGEGLQVGIKRVEGGVFSTFANEELRPGDVLEAMAPMGRFGVPFGERRDYLMVAGGSGITPVLSLIRTILRDEPESRVTLIYANRAISTIMFREALEDLKNTHLGRLSILHVLETEQDVELFTGRVDAAKIAALSEAWLDVPSLDLAFICGPEPMMLAVSEGLRAQGMAEEKIRFELFASSHSGPRPATAPAAKAGNTCAVSVTLDGVTREFEMPKDGTAVLDAALAQDMDAPYACKAGVCSTCRARVLEGEAEMRVNHALEDYEVRAGYVLSCQCVPLSDRLRLSYDA